jgi:hypothetical protein
MPFAKIAQGYSTSEFGLNKNAAGDCGERKRERELLIFEQQARL